jgi:hypothetical protein
MHVRTRLCEGLTPLIPIASLSHNAKTIPLSVIVFMFLRLRFRKQKKLSTLSHKNIKWFEQSSNHFAFISGDRGIRTLDTVTRIHAFQAGSFDHSDRSPCVAILSPKKRFP